MKKRFGLDNAFITQIQGADPITQIAYMYAGLSGESLNDLLYVVPKIEVIYNYGKLIHHPDKKTSMHDELQSSANEAENRAKAHMEIKTEQNTDTPSTETRSERETQLGTSIRHQDKYAEFITVYHDVKCAMRPKLYSLYEQVIHLITDPQFSNIHISTVHAYPFFKSQNFLHAFVTCMQIVDVNLKYEIKARRKTSAETIERGQKYWQSTRAMFVIIFDLDKKLVTKKAIDYYNLQQTPNNK